MMNVYKLMKEETNSNNVFYLINNAENYKNCDRYWR